MATEPNESIQNGERRLSRLEGVWEGASGNFATKADVLEAKAEVIQDNANTKDELNQKIDGVKADVAEIKTTLRLLFIFVPVMLAVFGFVLRLLP